MLVGMKMKTIALAPSPVLAVCTPTDFRPGTIPHILKTVVPDLHKIVLVNVSLNKRWTSHAETSRNRAVAHD